MKPVSNRLMTINDDSAVFGLQRLKSRIVDQISHEFRTPLTSIIGFAEILKDEVPINEEQRIEYAGYIQREGLRLTKLVDDLLELDALEHTQVELNLRESEMQQVIKQAAALLSETAYSKFIIISFDFPDYPLIVKLDCEKIVHVLYQLLHNAVRFTPPGGLVQIKAEANDTDIFFSVRDSGPGIPARDIPSLFKRFGKLYRFDEEAHGGGVGLAIVKHVIDQHKGDISVQSRVGEGSTFTVRIPRLM